jgi:hypothetical protein
VITTCIADYDKLESNLGKEERSTTDHLLYKLKKKRILVWEDWEDVFTLITTLIEHNANVISKGWRKTGFVELLEKLTAQHIHHRIRHEALRVLLQIIDLNMPLELDSTLAHLLVRAIDLPVYWTDVKHPCPPILEDQYDDAKMHIDNLPILTSQRQDSHVKRLSFRKKLSQSASRLPSDRKYEQDVKDTESGVMNDNESSTDVKEHFELWNTLLTFTLQGVERENGLNRFKLFLEMVHVKWLRMIYPETKNVLSPVPGVGVGTPFDATFTENLHIPQVIQDPLWSWFEKCCANPVVQGVLWSEPKYVGPPELPIC